MDPDLYGAGAIVAMMVFGGLAGLRMVLRAWTQRSASVEEIGELTRTVSELRDEMDALREHQQADMLEMEERVEFAERLLASGSEPERPEEKPLTPV